MPDTKAAWDDVGSRFSDLAGKVKEQFEARVAFGGPEAQKVDDAIRTLVRALDNAFTAIGDTLRDPATRDEAKQAASAMGDALASTFHDVADQIKLRAGGGGGGGSSSDGGGSGSASAPDSGAGGGYATPG
jgi:hypothetical protein